MGQTNIQGSCLCGKVTYQYDGKSRIFQFCHCSRCQKVTGSAHASNIIVNPDQFKWLTGEEYVSRYELPEAKYFATSFCNVCGSTLPWQTKAGKAVVIPAGTLDTDPHVKPMYNIFYADKAPWFEEVGTLAKYEALPVKNCT